MRQSTVRGRIDSGQENVAGRVDDNLNRIAREADRTAKRLENPMQSAHRAPVEPQPSGPTPASTGRESLLTGTFGMLWRRDASVRQASSYTLPSLKNCNAPDSGPGV